MFKALHIYSAAAKLDAFVLQTGSLLGGGGLRQLDLAASAEDSVPGQNVWWVGAEKAGDRTVVERIASGGGDVAVGADFAGGNRKQDATEGAVALVAWSRGVAQDVATSLEDCGLIVREGRLDFH